MPELLINIVPLGFALMTLVSVLCAFIYLCSYSNDDPDSSETAERVLPMSYVAAVLAVAFALYNSRSV
jgi:hypothetical protein